MFERFISAYIYVHFCCILSCQKNVNSVRLEISGGTVKEMCSLSKVRDMKVFLNSNSPLCVLNAKMS